MGCKVWSLDNPAGGGKSLIYNDIITFVNYQEPELKDYKFFCFNGEVKCFKIDFGRFTEHHANYYDSHGMLLHFGEKKFPPLESANTEIPSNLQEMVNLAEALSAKRPFVRVDFYNVSGKIYFGECTFSPAGGMGRFDPEEWDYTLGSWINLPIDKQ